MLNKKRLISPRFDCILVWGHGLGFLNELVSELENSDIFEILRIVKHRPKSLKQLVNEVYSYDYAPLSHLRSKTKYLHKTRNEVCFVFIQNHYPNEDLFGAGRFRHIESVSLKEFKEKFRDKFNPYENGIRSHNHVIHATDNELQTNALLRYLGYKNGVQFFSSSDKLFGWPQLEQSTSRVRVTKIPFTNLRCNVATGHSWEYFSLREEEVEQSPHYKSLHYGVNVYEDYLDKYLGGPIKAYNSPKKFIKMKVGFSYLREPYMSSYIIVKKSGDNYLILDGLHRAALHLYQGNKSIISCIVD